MERARRKIGCVLLVGSSMLSGCGGTVGDPAEGSGGSGATNSGGPGGCICFTGTGGFVGTDYTGGSTGTGGAPYVGVPVIGDPFPTGGTGPIGSLPMGGAGGEFSP